MQIEEGVVEARAGIEPAHKGFADLSLTTWVPRPEIHAIKAVREVPTNLYLANRSRKPSERRLQEAIGAGDGT